MKNIVFAIFCFLLGFFVGSGMLKVKAASGVVVDFTYFYDSYKNIYENNNYSQYLLPLIEALEKENKNYIIIRRNSYYHLLEYSSSSTTVKFNQFSTSLNLGSMTFSLDNRIKTFSFGVSNALTLANYINEHKDTPDNSIQGITLQVSSYQPDLTFEYNQESGVTFGGVNCVVLYASNMSIKISNLSARFLGVKFGDNIYRENSILPSYMSLVGYGKTYYTFNQKINTRNNSQIRFKFDIPQDKSFPFYFNYSVTVPMFQGDLAPYMAYSLLGEDDIERVYYLPLENYTYLEDDLKSYFGTEINVFRENITSLEFVVELESFKDLDEQVSIFFESEYPFAYEYITSANSYYEEVDWSGNYGVVLIPKLHDLETLKDSQVYSPIYFLGVDLGISIYSSTDTTKTPITEGRLGSETDYLNNKFSRIRYLFKPDNLNQIIFFTNSSYLTSSYRSVIRYDRRFFVHSICSDLEKCTIVNPNTGEEVTIIPPIVPPNGGNDDFTVDDVYDILFGFIDQMHDGRIYIEKCFNAFWREVPVIVQTLLLGIYSFVLLIVFLRIGGWNNE